ncbi:MAG: hypothetical protein H6936_00090 [Burkholderiales bacterium]|uniref:hypothetical protein n=1 Tax=Nitrosomonas sp. TaxID=42353 RepID=UPI001D7ADCAF|nr:hypothetical protein [Nitrosomonas sp.]MCB1949969.1 hypothetical protein [Nitrosomonas sp.]MCP5273257.1 hypothetical protein [Burkholderiales bacterium]
MTKMFLSNLFGFTLKPSLIDLPNQSMKGGLTDFKNPLLHSNLLEISTKPSLNDLSNFTFKSEFHNITEVIHSQDLLNFSTEPLTNVLNIEFKPEIEEFAKVSPSYEWPGFDPKYFLVDSTDGFNRESFDRISTNQEIESSFFHERVFDPISNRFDSVYKSIQEVTSEDVKDFFSNFAKEFINEIIESFPDIYSDIKEELGKLGEDRNINDIFYNTPASEYFNGGIGFDTVVYSGSHDDYHIKKTFAGYKVYGENNNEIDTLSGIENLEFSDVDIRLETLGVLGLEHI